MMSSFMELVSEENIDTTKIAEEANVVAPEVNINVFLGLGRWSLPTFHCET